MKRANKQMFRKLNHSLFRKKTPLLGFTVLQLLILFLVVNAGTVAVILSKRQQPVTQDTSNNLPTYEANSNTVETVNTTPQGTPQNNSSTKSAPANKPSTTTSNLPDQYGCIPQTSGYDSCVTYAKKNALSAWCSEQSKKAGDTYSATEDQAQAAYDAVMAEWNAVKDQPYYTHHPYDQYATDAKTKYNAIQKPAYSTYVGTINSLNAQGCNVIKTYSDTSWAGY